MPPDSHRMARAFGARILPPPETMTLATPLNTPIPPRSLRDDLIPVIFKIFFSLFL